MKPLPPTEEALAEIVSLREPDLGELLAALGSAASEIVPELVGLSLGLLQEGLTFTLVATDLDVSAFDAAQYLDGGPCVDVGEGRADRGHHASSDPLAEDRWHLFAAATAAHGVESTLSLPVHAEGELIGTVNLYAATPDAFDERIEALATLVGAVPTAAVRNADLSFSTRLEAAATPRRLREHAIVETAVGRLASDQGISPEMAHRALLDAAARAGLHVADAARVVVAAYNAED
jgi:GAF domain-containing protein